MDFVISTKSCLLGTTLILFFVHREMLSECHFSPVTGRREYIQIQSFWKCLMLTHRILQSLEHRFSAIQDKWIRRKTSNNFYFPLTCHEHQVELMADKRRYTLLKTKFIYGTHCYKIAHCDDKTRGLEISVVLCHEHKTL